MKLGRKFWLFQEVVLILTIAYIVGVLKGTNGEMLKAFATPLITLYLFYCTGNVGEWWTKRGTNNGTATGAGK